MLECEDAFSESNYRFQLAAKLYHEAVISTSFMGKKGKSFLSLNQRSYSCLAHNIFSFDNVIV